MRSQHSQSQSDDFFSVVAIHKSYKPSKKYATEGYIYHVQDLAHTEGEPATQLKNWM